MEKNPGDPAVAFEGIFRQDATPAERRESLEAFKRAAPENPLANYLSALEYFKSRQPDQAVQELAAASDRQGLTDYTVERIRLDEEAYRAAGYSECYVECRRAVFTKSHREPGSPGIHRG